MAAHKDKASSDWLEQNWPRVHRHLRFSVCASIFIVLAVVMSVLGLPAELSLLLAFNIAVVIFLGATVIMFSRSNTQSIRRRARKEDEGYWGFILSSAGVAIVVLVALAAELHTSKHTGSLQIALAVCSLILAWLFMNTIFALHYAHEFYGDSGSKNAGLDFPGNIDPDYWDFVYFAFVIGMTFQVSDVEINSRAIRRVVLAHSMIAFFFNVIVIALSVNILAGST
ncbi:DUF1345 domain-containing protein [Alcaligenaceae bacterium]|nr:DUF1345 domain-containing protein [Alcaligenaceae bacterium]